MDSGARAAFEALTEELRPLLNRLAFFGIETCRGELDPQSRVRAPAGTSPAAQATTTTQLSRLASELTALGWRRAGRAASVETWSNDSGRQLSLESVTDAVADERDAALLEYATLLTRTVAISGGDTVRVTALPVQVALLWRAHRRSGAAFSSSRWTEDLIELVARRPTVRDEVAALPSEVRQMVVLAATEFSSSEPALWTIERALPDARATPGVARTILARFREVADVSA